MSLNEGNRGASVMRWLPTPKSILKYSQRKVGQYGAPYVSFGLFCCFNFIFPYFMWSHEVDEGGYELLLYLRILGAVLCGLLVIKETWKPSFLPYLPTFWHLTLLYCIPFMSTIMLLTTHGSIEWLTHMAISIFFLIVLVDWLTFLLLTILGIVLGFFFYSQVVGPVSIQLGFIGWYLVVYQSIFATCI